MEEIIIDLIKILICGKDVGIIIHGLEIKFVLQKVIHQSLLLIRKLNVLYKYDIKYNYDNYCYNWPCVSSHVLRFIFSTFQSIQICYGKIAESAFYCYNTCCNLEDDEFSVIVIQEVIKSASLKPQKERRLTITSKLVWTMDKKNKYIYVTSNFWI